MFGVKYHIHYEAVLSAESVLKGFDILTVPLFGNVTDYVEAYCDAAADMNNISPASVIIVSLSKLN